MDGHDFVGAALSGGAVCALVMQPLDEAVRMLAAELGASVIEVPDTAHAVADIAREWRSHLHGRVIALTGSTGKTTTKNLVRDVLASTLSTVATAGNQNNELGVPKTLLAAEQDTQAVVVEMGMRGAGQLADLCDYVRPDWGLVVNVGESHIELLGSRENIARAKAELLCALPEGTGRAFVNADDDYADFVREHARLDARRVEPVLFAGSAAAAERRAQAEAAEAARPAVWAEQVELDEQGRPRFRLHAVGFADAPEEETARCALTLRGLHNVSNACAATAVGRACGIPLAVCADALAHAEPEAGRQEVLRARGGFTVVNDAYNANPDSMRASLATFCALDVPGKHVAVLGDMGELGSYAPACHAGIGEFAATLPLDRLVGVGRARRRRAGEGVSFHGSDSRSRRTGQLAMFTVFNQYPTFLVFLAVVFAMVVTMVLTPLWIKFLKSSHIGQQVRADGPESHLVKQGTPTMGGVIMLIAVIAVALFVGMPTPETFVLLAATVLTGLLGLVDDASKVVKERSLGLTPKAKIVGQVAIATAFVLVAVNWLGIQPTVEIPFVVTLDFGILTTVVPVGDGIAIPWLYLLFMNILLVGMCNAVNLTDGLDGLAAGTVMIVMIVMAAIAYRSDLLEPAIFAAALAGACIGFLWFNSFPADIFMGDTGSLALGMALGCLAVLTKTEFVSLIIGGLFVAEALSVMIQVFYYKKTKKRIFLMAPLHHHFEKKGWSETKVVVRFWIISGVLAATGFSLYFAETLMAVA